METQEPVLAKHGCLKELLPFQRQEIVLPPRDTEKKGGGGGILVSIFKITIP